MDSNLNIGARGTDKKGQMHHFFCGIIDEVFIYNRELAEAEVLQLFETKESYAVDSVDKLTTTWGEVKGAE